MVLELYSLKNRRGYVSASEPVGWVLCELVSVGKRLGCDNCQCAVNQNK